MGWVKSMPGDFGDFSVNIGLGINFLAFVPQFVTLRDTLTYGGHLMPIQLFSPMLTKTEAYIGKVQIFISMLKLLH